MNASGQANLQHLFKCLHFMGLKEVYVCPGSRNAPLIHAAFHTKSLTLHKVVDERSAAYQALGNTLISKKPVAIICTSGTAVLNLFPAIAEAVQLQLPLIILSADRPKSLYDNWENQTLNQERIFGKYVNAYFSWKGQLTRKRSIGKVEKLASQLFDSLQFPDQGPVHVNFHFDEPLYFSEPAKDYPIFSLSHRSSAFTPQKNIYQTLQPTTSVLIVAGQGNWNQSTEESIEKLVLKGAVLFCDLCSPYRRLQTHPLWERAVSFMTADEWKQMKPETLVITGAFLLNKNLKKLLQMGNFKQVIHIADRKNIKDPYFLKPKRTDYIRDQDIAQLHPEILNKYPKKWSSIINNWDNKTVGIDSKTLNDWNVLQILKQSLPVQSDSAIVIHAANSMSVRYVSLLGIPNHIPVFSNRGTSGIDGCLSTAMGAAQADNASLHLLITGDLAFFYDINALWQEKLPDNLKIIVLNNEGGNIFDMLPGPSSSDAYAFFTTPHTLTAKYMAQHFQTVYHTFNTLAAYKARIPEILFEKNTSIIEIHTNPQENKEIWKQLKTRKENG